MAKNSTKEERIKALVAELLADEAAEGVDLEHENINDIEDEMVRIGDLVAREVGVQKLARHTRVEGQSPQCPNCGRVGERLGEQARDLITRRGKVPLTEAKYRCPKCRRHFFPSDQSAGD
jgi:hypothetical protein